MLLQKFSNIQFIHTAGTNLTCGFDQSRLSQVTNKLCQLQHKTLPPHIEFTQLKPNNSLKKNPIFT